MTITHTQLEEISRLAGMVATARCRRVAVALGRPVGCETDDSVEARCESAAADMTDYLFTLLEK